MSNTFQRRLRNSGLLLLLLIPTSSLATAATDDAFFDATKLHEIRLSLDPTLWQKLQANYLANDYYPAAFAWNSEVLSNIGIRSRGSGSRSPEKPNLTLKFNKYTKQKLLGHNTVTLKANNQDASMMREILGMELLRRMGIPAPREAFAKLFINGEFWGLYTIVEAVDEEFLTRNYKESDGYLYDFNPVLKYNFEYLGPDPAAYSLFEPQTNEDSPNTSALMEMIRVVNQASDADFPKLASPLVDYHEFMAIVAMENYISDEDSILSDTYGMNNFYLYFPGNSTRSTFIPWDADISFVDPSRDILQNIDANVLARRAFAIPEVRQYYYEVLVQAATLAGPQGGWMSQEVERLYALIGDAARLDPHKQCADTGVIAACSAANFESGVSSLRAFPDARYSYVIPRAFAGWNPAAPAIAASGVVDAASNLPKLVPGSLATMYGSSLAIAGQQAQSLPLPQVLGQANITINGRSAPMLFASPLQVNFQVPWSTATGTASLAMNVAGQLGGPVNITVVRTAPAIYIAQHAGRGAVSVGDPAVPGETIVVYASGLGPVAGDVADGAAPVGLVQTQTPVSATVGTQDARVTFAGLAPGMVGVYQVNVELPSTLPTTAALVLKVADTTSVAYPLR